MVTLSEVVASADAWLQPSLFQDYDRAWNGLQVENSGTVTRLAAAVDASMTTIHRAIDAGANLMVVHHGLFWNETRPWTGRRYALLKCLMDHDLAIYSQHLPLDGHPRLGNAAQLATGLGWNAQQPFFYRSGVAIGVQSTLVKPLNRTELGLQLGACLGRPPLLLPGGPTLCQRIGICTGGAGSDLAQAVAEGVDTFITGEGPHWTHALAEDLGVNVFYGGHYATETFGVKALASELGAIFGLPWTFIDHPSGL
jgi:dinuclear metal center YbgI/SA1388 family protein